MPINARTKGNSFEIVVAKRLTEWWGLNFRRVPLSGGYDKRLVVGDLWIADRSATIEEIKGFPFSIEAKNREGWDWNILFGPGNSSLMEYWKQAKDDASKLDKIALLIFKKNFSPLYVGWDEGLLYDRRIRRTAVHNPDVTEILAVSMLEDWLKIFTRQRIEYLLSKRTPLMGI